MSLFSSKSNNDAPQSFPPSLVSTSDSTSEEEHLGAMASPNYCNSLDCWCHTSVAYHDKVNSLPANASGDDVYQSLSFLLSRDY